MAALVLATPARSTTPRLLELSVRHIAGGRAAREPGALGRHAGGRLRHPPGPRGYAYQLYATAGLSILLWLHRDPQPALVIAGEDDPSGPLRNGRVLAARLPNARQPGVKWGGHPFLLDEPETVAGVIRDFLDAPWRGRARGAQR